MYNLSVNMFVKIFVSVIIKITISCRLYCLMYISVQDIPEPLSRPDDSEYQEFRNYLAVTESATREQHEEQVCHPNSTFAFENLF